MMIFILYLVPTILGEINFIREPTPFSAGPDDIGVLICEVTVDKPGYGKFQMYKNLNYF